MSIATAHTDLEAICNAIAAGRPIDSEVSKRVHERAEQVRQKILETHGVVEVAVDLIREIRDEE